MTSDVPIAGFWSYARKDDEAEGGRITDLGRDLAKQYELLTGQPIDLFLDRDSVGWGERWREAIDAGVRNSAFFVAVMTPAYFQSAACRNELQTFARSARELGVKELVLPLKYVTFPGMDGDSDDQLVRLATEFQWVDWTETRFADRESEAYRRAVGAMAARLADVNRVLDERAARDIAESPTYEEGPEEEPPGTLDLMETAERVLPEWTKTVEGLSEEVRAVGEIFTRGSEKLKEDERRGRASFAGRVVVAKQIAHELVPHSERIRDLGMGFAEQVHDVDGGVEAMLRQIAANPPGDLEELETTCDFVRTMRRLAGGMREGLEKMMGMLTASEQLAGQSRDLRAPLGVMKEGLTAMREGQAVAERWDQLISDIPINCEDEESSLT